MQRASDDHAGALELVSGRLRLRSAGVLSRGSPIGSSSRAVPPAGTEACWATGRPRQIAEKLSSQAGRSSTANRPPVTVTRRRDWGSGSSSPPTIQLSSARSKLPLASRGVAPSSRPVPPSSRRAALR